ncbi:hypothetical protein [Nocardioides nitrophenolicus]|uniref:hypothetical protein n=1 Tax=Nocardioides nitrophenolicus TaxID=60489 RepID=UPI001959E317|nr:hypothetical protein [Nocardioides nitrophenolicus]MBM7518145.1 hypothetical protein [Nocardioides nitrophenolicus]
MDVSRILGTGAVLLLGAALTGCGGPPGDASAHEFCATWQQDSGNGVEGARDRAAALEEVGTPAGLGDDARDGFEIFVEQLGSIDAEQLTQLDQVAADVTSLADVYGIDEDEAEDVLAFFDYVTATCAE